MKDYTIDILLDEEAYGDLQLIQEKLGHVSVSEALKNALRYTAERCTAEEILARLGGIAEGPEDLSERYKDALYKGLKEKHGID